MKRRFPDWRMRPISVDGRDNTTRLERGPQGTGGDGAAGGFARSGGLPIGGRHRRRAEQTRYLIGGMAGSALTSTMLRKAPYRTVRCLMLRAGLWENPMSGILGGAAGNVYYGGTANPPATERAGPDKPPPTVARASALPDKGVTSRLRREPCAGHREVSCEVSVAARVGRAIECRNTVIRNTEAVSAAEGNTDRPLS